MILAAGLGTRMRPLTDHVPKAMILLRGRPLIAYAIEGLKSHGIRRIVVNTHYKPEPIRSYLAAHHPDIMESFELERLETAGGIKNALPFFEGEAIFVVNADVIWRGGLQTALRTLESSWRPHHMDSLLSLLPKERAHLFSGAGDYDFSAAPHLVWRHHRPSARYYYASASIIKTSAYHGLTTRFLSNKAVWDGLESRNRLCGVEIDDEAFDIGHPAGLAHVEQYFSSIAS